MSHWVVWGAMIACGFGETARRAPSTVACPDGATLRETAPDAPLDSRFAEGTRVLQCVNAQTELVGDQLELHAESDTVAVEGAWADGQRVGTWTEWGSDGAFARLASYDAGAPTGEWIEVTPDGRLTGVTFDGGVVVGLRSLPIDTEMPEWDQGRETQGRRYQGTVD